MAYRRLAGTVRANHVAFSASPARQRGQVDSNRFNAWGTAGVGILGSNRLLAERRPQAVEIG